MPFSSALVLTTSTLALTIGLSTPALAQDADPANPVVGACAGPDAAQDQSNCSGVAAPEAAQDDMAIVVTGSRIRRPNFETLQPAVVIDSKEIENRGFETLGQAINEQPSFGVPGATSIGAGQAGAFGSGQSFANFLGLGDQRTLTIVNGRRFVSSNTASIFGPSNLGSQVDLNSINTKLVDRVETIAIGGAPIYGSDAIAGTINVILKRDYEGLEFDAQYGVAARGDAPNWRLRGLWGMNFGADDRGNVTVSAEFNKGKGLLYNDRAATRAGLFYADCPEGSKFSQCLFNNRRIPSISESGVLTVGGDQYGLNFPLSPDQSEYLIFGDPTLNFGVIDGGGNQLQFNPRGELTAIDFGNPVGCIPCGDFNIDFSGGNGYNIANTSQLLTDTKRYNANILTQYELTDRLRVFGEGWFAYSKGTQLRNQPVYNSGLFGAAGTPDGPLVMSIDNPFLTPEQRQTILDSINLNPFSDQNEGLVGVQDYFYLSRANTDIATSRASTATTLYRFVGGLDGEFNLGGRNFQYEVVANYGRAKTKGRSIEIVQQNFENAIDAVVDGSGNIICRPGHVNSGMPTLSSTCAPLNLFGSGRASQAALDYVTAIADPTGINEQFVLTASVSGSLVDLPGGDLSFALGAERRRESTNFDPGKFYNGGDDLDPLVDGNGDGDPANDRVQYGRSVPIFPVKGHYTTKEAFGELRAQVVGPENDIPGVRSLELHGAARFVDHSTAGSDWTYTIEGRWGIIQDIALRGNYTRAIRAPAITEAFNPSSSYYGFASDPCDADNLVAGPDPATRQANCLAAGLPGDFQSLSNQRSFTQALAGNVDLANEKSNAWSVGVILNPRFIPGLTISADYLDIKLKDVISSFSATQVVNACYDDPDFATNEFCDLVQRDLTGDPETNANYGQLTFVETRFFNASEFRYKGILGSLDYRTRTPFLGANSQVGVNMSYQYLDTLTNKAADDSKPTHLDGSIGYPKHSAVLNLNYQNGPLGLFSSFNYTGKVKVDPDVPADFYQYPTRDDVVFVNVGANFDINNKMTLRFVVDNLFDTDPPFGAPAGGGTVSYFPGILGRYFRVGASVKF